MINLKFTCMQQSSCTVFRQLFSHGSCLRGKERGNTRQRTGHDAKHSTLANVAVQYHGLYPVPDEILGVHEPPVIHAASENITHRKYLIMISY